MESNPNQNPVVNNAVPGAMPGAAQMYPPNMIPNYPQPQQPQANTRGANCLTEEQIALLRKQLPQFSLAVSKEDVWRGQCNHHQNGYPQLICGDDGITYTCTICGAQFKNKSYTQAEVEQITDDFLNILNLIKLLYGGTLPKDAALQYFQITPLCAKAPNLYKMAVDAASRFENANNWTYTQYGPSYNLFNAVMNRGPIIPPQAPYYPPQYAVPQVPIQQVQPAPTGWNPLTGTPMAQPVYAPQNTGFVYNPPMAQPAAPAQTAQQTPQNGVNVNANFSK